MGLDWRWERLNVIQPPSPTGSFTFNAIGSDLPGTANTGTPLASFFCSVRCRIFRSTCRRPSFRTAPHFQEYLLHPGRLEGVRIASHP